MSGSFIAIEGIDGSGKSTVAARLASALRRLGSEVVSTREPGGTAIGEQIRGMLLSTTSASISPETEALLFSAARSQLVVEIIRPALLRGAVVLTDRFSDSTLAYQGGGRGLPQVLLMAAQDLATGGVEPDLKLLLDLPPETAIVRRRSDGSDQNRLDREALEFYGRVRDAYHEIAATDPERWRIIDASGPPEQVWADVWRELVTSQLVPPARAAGEKPAT